MTGRQNRIIEFVHSSAKKAQCAAHNNPNKRLPTPGLVESSAMQDLAIIQMYNFINLI